MLFRSDATVEAFDQSGHVARTIDRDVTNAEHHLQEVRRAGVDVEQVAAQLEAAGLKSFQESFDDLLATLANKAATR